MCLIIAISSFTFVGCKPPEDVSNDTTGETDVSENDTEDGTEGENGENGEDEDSSTTSG
jgi:hypothetical protein